MRDLDGRECLDVHLRVPRLERAKHRLVVLEASLHVEPADDVELARDRSIGAVRFSEHLLEAVAIGTVFFR